MNNPNSQLKDLIHVERGIIPANLCEYLVEAIEKNEWRPHTWYNNVQGTFGSEETMELDVQNITPQNRTAHDTFFPLELYNFLFQSEHC